MQNAVESVKSVLLVTNISLVILFIFGREGEQNTKYAVIHYSQSEQSSFMA